MKKLLALAALAFVSFKVGRAHHKYQMVQEHPELPESQEIAQAYTDLKDSWNDARNLTR